MKIDYCLRFNQPDAQILKLTGGKGSNLAKMTAAGFPVPNGFIITTTAFDFFLQANQIDQIIQNALFAISSNDPGVIQEIGKKVREQIHQTPIPDDLIEAVHLALQNHPPELHFAVRSSATAEDLPYASFAGQQDTYLNVFGLPSILEHIRKCWASLYTDRAITYRLQNQINQKDIKIAVVVQEMVFPETSGILFTADPVSNNHRVITINAGFGLGEALVSGIVNPDLYRVDKNTGRVIEKEISNKTTAILAAESGGTQQVTLDSNQQQTEVLTNQQIEALTALGKKVEKAYLTPQDIEWAFENENLFLLQTRPITSLYPIPSPPPLENNLHIYFSFGHVQMMTEPISPMGISILRLLLPFGCPPSQSVYSPYLLPAGGRLFVDLTSILNSKPGKIIFPKILVGAEPIAAQQIKNLLQTDQFLIRNKTNEHHIKLSFLSEWVFPLFGRLISWAFFRRLNNTAAQVLEKNQKYLTEQKNLLNSISNKINFLVTLKRSISSFFHQGLVWMLPIVASGIMAKFLLEKILSHFDLKQEVLSLQRGLIGNITTEMDLMVGDLTDLVQTQPKLHQTLTQHLEQNKNWSDFPFKSFPQFNKLWSEFLDRFGQRGPGEIDIAHLRWNENPQSLFQIILASHQNRPIGEHRRHFTLLTEINHQSQEKIITTLKGSLKGRLILPFVKRLMRLLTNLAPIREHPKYLIVSYLDFVRTKLLNLANELKNKGLIDETRDVWFLDYEELVNYFNGESIDFKTRIQQRKQAYDHYKKLTPPRVITSDGEIPREKLHREGLPENALIGSPVSAGYVEGIARVILDPSQEQLNPGEILVAPYTDPGWTPLFIHAAGVVIETGGLMTHGSVVAREYGLPAVVGIMDVTKTIQTGMKIRVDGDSGYVLILENNSQPFH
ncbi:MAG: phosphoenolpyruvate synthase [Anaerolineaceae bacterium]|nr:phosphoenolpyruvate synthase [Anaerolineaceae bacterium]